MITDSLYNSALSRLTRKFNLSQSKLLASLMVAQAKHETGNFTSSVFKNNNNAFGYKYYKGSLYQIGKGKTSPELDSYGNFNTPEDSAKEVADWLGRRKADFEKISTPAEYGHLLKKYKYYGADENLYITALKNFFTPIISSTSELISSTKETIQKKKSLKFIIIIPFLLIGFLLFKKYKK